MQDFLSRFRFDPAKQLLVGVERECFITRAGLMVPMALEILNHLKPFGKRFGYELSACQLEERTEAAKLENVLEQLISNENLLRRTENELLFTRSYTDVGPEDMCLEVYPDSSGRYAKIASRMPRHVLLAACRIIGTHIHVGMPDFQTALRVYNSVIRHSNQLYILGDESNGQRLDIYRIVAPHCDPQRYGTPEDLYQQAVQQGFSHDPRQCWTLIRISIHGTIEFRMFGATSSLKRVAEWAAICHDLCKAAMH